MWVVQEPNKGQEKAKEKWGSLEVSRCRCAQTERDIIITCIAQLRPTYLAREQGGSKANIGGWAFLRAFAGDKTRKYVFREHAWIATKQNTK